jgi:hypothetical protein
LDFLIPQPNAVLELHMRKGATICVRRHGKERRSRLCCRTGTGFAIGAYSRSVAVKHPEAVPGTVREHLRVRGGGNVVQGVSSAALRQHATLIRTFRERFTSL